LGTASIYENGLKLRAHSITLRFDSAFKAPSFHIPAHPIRARRFTVRLRYQLLLQTNLTLAAPMQTAALDFYCQCELECGMKGRAMSKSEHHEHIREINQRLNSALTQVTREDFSRLAFENTPCNLRSPYKHASLPSSAAMTASLRRLAQMETTDNRASSLGNDAGTSVSSALPSGRMQHSARVVGPPSRTGSSASLSRPDSRPVVSSGRRLVLDSPDEQMRRNLALPVGISADFAERLKDATFVSAETCRDEKEIKNLRILSNLRTALDCVAHSIKDQAPNDTGDCNAQAEDKLRSIRDTLSAISGASEKIKETRQSLRKNLDDVERELMSRKEALDRMKPVQISTGMCLIDPVECRKLKHVKSIISDFQSKNRPQLSSLLQHLP
jgi:hypothetical protein